MMCRREWFQDNTVFINIKTVVEAKKNNTIAKIYIFQISHRGWLCRSVLQYLILPVVFVLVFCVPLTFVAVKKWNTELELTP